MFGSYGYNLVLGFALLYISYIYIYKYEFFHVLVCIHAAGKTNKGEERIKGHIKGK